MLVCKTVADQLCQEVFLRREQVIENYLPPDENENNFEEMCREALADAIFHGKPIFLHFGFWKYKKNIVYHEKDMAKYEEHMRAFTETKQKAKETADKLDRLGYTVLVEGNGYIFWYDPEDII